MVSVLPETLTGLVSLDPALEGLFSPTPTRPLSGVHYGLWLSKDGSSWDRQEATGLQQRTQAQSGVWKEEAKAPQAALLNERGACSLTSAFNKVILGSGSETPQYTEREACSKTEVCQDSVCWDLERLLSLVSELGIKGSSLEGRLWFLEGVEGFCGGQSQMK